MRTNDELEPLVQTLCDLQAATSSRVDAAKWLSESPTSEVFDALWKCRDDKVDRVRRAVVKALGAHHRPDVQSFLYDCLQDQDEFVRRNAFEALSRSPANETLIRECIHLLNDSSAEVRRVALSFAHQHREDPRLDAAIKSIIALEEEASRVEREKEKAKQLRERHARDPLYVYVEALILISQRMATSAGFGFLGAGRVECRRIGEEIYSLSGEAGMADVCEKIKYTLGAGAYRELERAWDGIGSWRG